MEQQSNWKKVIKKGDLGLTLYRNFGILYSTKENKHPQPKGEKHEKKEIPKGMYVWTIDPLFGDRIP